LKPNWTLVSDREISIAPSASSRSFSS